MKTFSPERSTIIWGGSSLLIMIWFCLVVSFGGTFVLLPLLACVLLAWGLVCQR
jgi:hypothetical protein